MWLGSRLRLAAGLVAKEASGTVAGATGPLKTVTSRTRLRPGFDRRVFQRRVTTGRCRSAPAVQAKRLFGAFQVVGDLLLGEAPLASDQVAGEQAFFARRGLRCLRRSGRPNRPARRACLPTVSGRVHQQVVPPVPGSLAIRSMPARTNAAQDGRSDIRATPPGGGDALARMRNRGGGWPCPKGLAEGSILDSGSSRLTRIISQDRPVSANIGRLAAGRACSTELLRLVALRFGEVLVDRGGVLRLVLGRLDRGHSSPLANVCTEV